jgi:hypothetical protein
MRIERRMGQILVDVRIENALDRSHRIECIGMVDTGAFGLVLPEAWRQRLGHLPDRAAVDVERADQRVVTSEICGPARIQLDGFRWVTGEVIFVDMEPGPGGRFEPLVGYHVLESCNAMVDMVRHRLVARKHYHLKRVA